MTIDDLKTQEISVDINDNKTYEYFYAKQYDTGRIFIINITKDGNPFNLSDCTVIANMKKPDGTVKMDSCTIISENQIQLIATDQVTVLSGKIPLDIQITNGSATIKTITLYIKVEGSVIHPDDVISSDEFNALNDLLIKASTDYSYIMDNCQVSADAAKQSEINAKDSETKALEYLTNTISKASEASDSASSALTSANNAIEHANSASLSASNASDFARNASDSAIDSSNSAIASESYAIGGTGSRTGEDIDNAKYYNEQAQKALENMQNAQVTGVKGDSETEYRKGEVNITKSNIGLENVENKSSETIRSEITKENVTNALGYVPAYEIISNEEPTNQNIGDFWLQEY